jgi:hypothetical protein
VGDVGLSGHGAAGLAVAASAPVAVDDDGVDDEANEEHDAEVGILGSARGPYRPQEQGEAKTYNWMQPRAALAATTAA